MNKIKIQHAVTMIKNGKLEIVPGIETEETLEDLRTIMKDGADYFIDSLLKSTKGHIITHGVMVHSLIHIIHDDEANNIQYQNMLLQERKAERKEKLNRINEKILENLS